MKRKRKSEKEKRKEKKKKKRKKKKEKEKRKEKIVEDLITFYKLGNILSPGHLESIRRWGSEILLYGWFVPEYVITPQISVWFTGTSWIN